jgi:hypothetical protein
MNALPSAEDLARAAAAAPFDVLHYCTAVDAFAQPVMRQSLCTVNRFEHDTMQLVRLYSSNPVAYPPGGRKDKRGTAWGEQVLVRHQMYVGEGAEAIRASFDDHAAIERLGLRSVVNVPVAFAERCLGTLNLLMTAARVTPEQIEFARLLGVLLLPGFLAVARAD